MPTPPAWTATRAALPRLALAAWASLALCACAPGAGSRPGWVDRPASAGEDDARITAVGVGRTRVEAEHAALARLAQRLEAGVMTRETLDRRDSVGDGPSSSSTRFDRSIELRSDVTLYAARIEAVHYAPDERLHYALGALDRRAGGQAHAARSRALADEARGALDTASAAATPLRKRAALLDARDRARGALAHARAALIVAPSGEADAAPLRDALELASTAGAGLSDAGGAINFSVQGGAGVTQDMLDAVRAAAIEVGGGAHPAAAGVGALRVVYAYIPAPSHAPGQAVARWRVSLWLVDTGDGSTLGELVRTGAVSAPGESETRHQAARAAERALAVEAPAFLRSLLRTPTGENPGRDAP